MAYLDAIGDIIDELQTIGGIKRVPDQPPEKTSDFPFAVVIPGGSSYVAQPARVMTGLHNINIELHVGRKDLPRDYSAIMNVIDTIPYELMKLRQDGGFSNLETFGNIESSPLQYMSYGGVETIGIVYTLTNVKVMTTIS